MSLEIYRRHSADCKHARDRVSKECRCALWFTGTLFGKPYRKSAKTRSWKAARKIKEQLEDGEKPGHAQPLPITIVEALDGFIKDCESRNLNRSTLRKYRSLRTNLAQHSEAVGINQLSECTPDYVRQFRQGRRLAPRTSGKELERLRAFFRFCVDNEWIAKNPAKAIKTPQVRVSPRLPFTNEEVGNIVAKAEDDRELAFFLVLRYTGLRVGDASLLRTSQLFENRIYLYTTKAGTPVSVLIPVSLESLLKSLPTPGGYFFLRGESTSMHTTADLWRRRFKAVCKDAKIVPDHPHRMRHTLAADLLSNGASAADVAAILGNSEAVVQKHYSQWIKSRQDRLDTIISSTWETKLRRVK